MRLREWRADRALRKAERAQAAAEAALRAGNVAEAKRLLVASRRHLAREAALRGDAEDDTDED